MNSMDSAPNDKEILVKLSYGNFAVVVKRETRGEVWYIPGEGICSAESDLFGKPLGWWPLPE